MRTSKNDPHLLKKAVTIKDGSPLRIQNGLNLSSMVNRGELIWKELVEKNRYLAQKDRNTSFEGKGIRMWWSIRLLPYE